MLRQTLIRLFCVLLAGGVATAAADDLPDLKARGVIRHLGVPYANFVTGAGDGFSVDMMKLFRKHKIGAGLVLEREAKTKTRKL